MLRPAFRLASYQGFRYRLTRKNGIPMKRLHTDVKVLLGMAAVLTLPFTLTLLTISQPRAPLDPQTNPTPHGYTWSLSLFIIPVLVLAVWLGRRRESRAQNHAFWLTAALVSGCEALGARRILRGQLFHVPQYRRHTGNPFQWLLVH